MSCREEFKVTEIQIGKEGNKIYFHPDGDMMLRDDFVPGIKLKDLAGLNTDEVILDPAVVIAVSVSDWGLNVVDGQDIYYATVFHNLNIDSYKYNVILTASDGTSVTINEIQKNENSVILESTVAFDLYVTVKRVY